MVFCHIFWNGKNDYSSLCLLEKHLKLCRILRLSSSSDYLYITGCIFFIADYLYGCKAYVYLSNAIFPLELLLQSSIQISVLSKLFFKTAVPWEAAKHHRATHSARVPARVRDRQEEQKQQKSRVKLKVV